jgi:hypothetical protein
MPNKGFLLVQMQPPPAFEEEFNAWYDTDHVPERLAVPGFETARRFVCIDGWPRYLALYDLASLDVLDTPAYHRVSGDNYTPWTRRVLSRVRVFRATGTQHYPGNVITGDAGRFVLLHFRDVHAQEQPALLAGLRTAYQDRPETTQLRLLTTVADGVGDCFGLVETRAPSANPPLALGVFGACAAKLDTINVYARY